MCWFYSTCKLCKLHCPSHISKWFWNMQCLKLPSQSEVMLNSLRAEPLMIWGEAQAKLRGKNYSPSSTEKNQPKLISRLARKKNSSRILCPGRPPPQIINGSPLKPHFCQHELFSNLIFGPVVTDEQIDCDAYKLTKAIFSYTSVVPEICSRKAKWTNVFTPGFSCYVICNKLRFFDIPQYRSVHRRKTVFMKLCHFN